MNILEQILGKGDKPIVTVAIDIKDEGIVKLVFGGAVLIFLACIGYVIAKNY